MQAALIAAALLFVYWGTLLAYLRDQHYQEHFVYLWLFLVLALTRTVRGPFRSRFAFSSRRDRGAVLLALGGIALFGASEFAGTTTGIRTSLVVFVTACALLALPRWTVKRCLMHGLLMQLCFGIPFSYYFLLTSQLQHGVAAIIAIPAWLGIANYSVEATVVRFPHYQLSITPDCAGLGQLLTFVGIGTLGVLSSARNGKRTVLVLLLAVALAWLSNIARVSLFVLLVGIGWTDAIDNETWHATLGTLVYLPFVAVLVAVILKTHEQPSLTGGLAPAPGRWPIALLLTPLLALHLAFGLRTDPPVPEPSYFAALSTPPRHHLEMRAPSEDSDRGAYATPWLLNARFRHSDDEYFDLFHYVTSSKSHLCVHKIANCLYAPGQEVRYEPPVEIDGKPWWRISLDREHAASSAHVYFFFEVGGQRCDDSASTQLAVFRQRLTGGDWRVRLTRVMLPGPLPPSPTPYEAEVLGWLGRTVQP